MKEKFNSIDLFKFFMAIAVVAIHTNPFAHCESTLVNQVVIVIEDISVPFFFMASGYLLAVRWGDTCQQRKKCIQKSLFSTVRLYTVWTLLSLPLTIYGYVISDNNIVSCILSYIKYFFFVGKLYNSYHLWYLLAMIYAFLVMWVLIHYEKNTLHILMIGIFFYFIYLVLAWIRQSEEESGLLAGVGRAFDFVFNNGGVFTGLFYMSIGIFFREYRRNNVPVSVVGIVTGILIKYGLSQEFGNILVAVMFFALVLNIKLKNRKSYMILRNLSKYIYLSHLLCFSFYTFVIIRQPNKLGVDSFIVTFVLATLFSSAIICGKELTKRGAVKVAL